MPLRRQRGITLSLIVIANVAFADISGEVDTGAELRPLYVRAGTYLPDSSMQARIDGRDSNVGSRLDFEGDLNAEKRKPTILAGVRWRFEDRHFLEVEYFNLKRSGQARVETEIRLGDATFRVDADVSSSSTTEVTRLGHPYRIVRRPDWGLALSADIHATRLRALIDSMTFDNGGTLHPTREIAGVTAPLPVSGISGARRLGGNWVHVARGHWNFLEVDDIDGNITHAVAFLEHQTLCSFGCDYDWFDIDAETTDACWRGCADIRFKGPLLSMQGSI